MRRAFAEMRVSEAHRTTSFWQTRAASRSLTHTLRPSSCIESNTPPRVQDVEEVLRHDGRTNFFVTNERFPTIWGGSSLLDMFLHVVRWSETHADFQRWGKLANICVDWSKWCRCFRLHTQLERVRLSASVTCGARGHAHCVSSQQWLATVCCSSYRNKGKSFLASHGYNTANFLSKRSRDC